jgi:flavin reductase (DIM6/NTAB) family NADH-FMN oxidoreductase RutF
MFYETAKNDHGLARPPFKSCVVPRPIGWLSTVSADGVDNLAPYSQFTNLTFDPPRVLVSVNRNPNGTRKDTAVNIEATKEFVYNIVPYALKDAMDISATPFPPEVDEFEKAGLTKAPCRLVKPCRVAESPINLECRYEQTIVLPGDSKTGTVDVIIGRVVAVHIADEVIGPDGKIDMEQIQPLARMGYSDYTYAEHVFELNSTKGVDPSAMARRGLEGATGMVP